MSERVRERSCERNGMRSFVPPTGHVPSIPLALEEKAEALPHPDGNRSTKKVKIRKDNHFSHSDPLSYDPISSDDDMPLDEDEPQPEMPQPPPASDSASPVSSSSKSFKDMLLNSSGPKEDHEDLLLMDSDITINTKNSVSSIFFSDRVHQIINESMKFALVIKMLGRHIRYTDLRDRVVSLWKISGLVQLIDMDNNCFIAKLDNERD